MSSTLHQRILHDIFRGYSWRWSILVRPLCTLCTCQKCLVYLCCQSLRRRFTKNSWHNIAFATFPKRQRFVFSSLSFSCRLRGAASSLGGTSSFESELFGYSIYCDRKLRFSNSGMWYKAMSVYFSKKSLSLIPTIVSRTLYYPERTLSKARSIAWFRQVCFRISTTISFFTKQA